MLAIFVVVLEMSGIVIRLAMCMRKWLKEIVGGKTITMMQ
jgi:hypothetical protein